MQIKRLLNDIDVVAGDKLINSQGEQMMRNVNILLCLLIVIFQVPNAFTQVTPFDFSDAKGLDLKAPNYPNLGARAGKAWVVVTTMIDTEGKSYEEMVESSSLRENSLKRSFEREALSAMRRSTFEPAQINGKPTASSISFIYRFKIEDFEMGVSTRFRRIQDEFEEENLEKN